MRVECGPRSNLRKTGHGGRHGILGGFRLDQHVEDYLSDEQLAAKAGGIPGYRCRKLNNTVAEISEGFVPLGK